MMTSRLSILALAAALAVHAGPAPLLAQTSDGETETDAGPESGQTGTQSDPSKRSSWTLGRSTPGSPPCQAS